MESESQHSSRSWANSLGKRQTLMKAIISSAFRLAGRTAINGDELELEAKVWEYALGDVPTHHLEECFRRAARAHEGTYMVLATEIRQQYTEMLPELQRQAQEAENENALRLTSGRQNFGYISIATFKERHNLPPQWKLGDPYPPESDLHDTPVPPMPEQVYECQTCKGARWVKHYPQGPLYPKLMPCPYCGA